MPLTQSHEANDSSVHHIDGPLTIYTVGHERERLLARLKAPAPLILDLGKVTECDSAGLQLLCAFQKSARQAGRKLRWLTIAEPVRRCASEAGFPESSFQPDQARHP